MACWNDGVQGSARPHTLTVNRAIAVDIRLHQSLSIDENMTPWIHCDPLSRQCYYPLDVGVASGIGYPGQAA
jgi:hypothetical protein